MPDYLIAVAVGPVQNFIAAARATHDLWFGSYVLSEVSKAVAFELHRQKAELIFPNPENPDEDLKPREDSSGLNVANKLLALVNQESPEAVKKILETAQQAACTRWKDLAENIRNKFGKHIRQNIWDLQVNDVLELYSAWVKLGDSQDAYQKARERVEQLLSARKSTRDFKPAVARRFNEEPYFGLPKSSLDAAREAVLEKLPDDDTRRSRLSEGEQLDCPGVVKRFGGKPEQFPSVVRVALEAWLQPIPKEELEGLKPHYDALVDKGRATRTASKRYKKLPFDGSLLFPDRIEALRQQIKEAEEKEKKKEVFSQYTLKKLGEAQTSLNKLEEARKPLYEKYGKPTPYYAILVADGDKMGELLDDKDCSTHQAISGALNHFAQEARKIVENEIYRGACVYTGGDDVMALLPIDTAVACADELRNAFEKNLTEIDPQKSPKLSVGLGIVHAMNPFSHSLAVARHAEKLAKNGKEGTAKEQQRNALAIIVDVRSGTEIEVRGQWDSGIVERLCDWQECYNKQKLSSKTPYDLLAAVQEMSWARDREDFKDIAQKEISRVLKKKRANAGTQELSKEVMESIKDEIDKAIKNGQDIFLILNELLVARWLTQKGA